MMVSEDSLDSDLEEALAEIRAFEVDRGEKISLVAKTLFVFGRDDFERAVSLIVPRGS